MKKEIIQILMVYTPLVAFIFFAYYLEGYDPIDIIGMISVSTILAFAFIAWIKFVVDEF